MKEAMERYGVSSGSLNSALTYGYSTGGYHFYRADEPKPDDSFFKSGNGGKGSSKEGRSVGGTIVCSFYGKPENYFRFKMQQMPQRVLYQDIEKGRELDARAKLQLFGSNIASPDLDRRIIRPPECIVKLRADTPQMETHGRETSRVRRESRDMASGRAALDAGRRAETARVTERHIDSNLK